jgi:septal ring factor EnvC (AmiA/AmiB activator)
MKAFAEGLAVLEQVAPPSAAATFQSAKGSLPLPVAGRILRGYDQPDAAGIKRPGLVLATEPGALMTAPWAATLRYVGPLLDYGNVMILEPAGDTLMVLAGMDQVYGAAGDIVQAGAPLGLMGGAIPSADAILADISDGSGAARTETLYLELRMAAKPVDPTDWFAETRD